LASNPVVAFQPVSCHPSPAPGYRVDGPGPSARFAPSAKQSMTLSPAGRAAPPRLRCQNVSVDLHGRSVLRGIDLEIGQRGVLALVGPSGSGKTTLLRCLNRMTDGTPGIRVAGRIQLDGRDIHAPDMDVVRLRARVGMVCQTPNPYPKSIFENIAYGPRIQGLTALRVQEDAVVEAALRRAGLWKEVKDRLDQPALGLSLGQQQRLCVARALAVNPDIILMDEPGSALDPAAVHQLEQLIKDLSADLAIALVTHSLAQARRVAEHTALLHGGRLVEVGATPSC
jgi:phosphate transport system ATP-binding protein